MSNDNCIAIGSFAVNWCLGTDLGQAKAEFCSRGGRLEDGYVVLIFNTTTATLELDEEGRIVWSGPAPERRVVGRYCRPGAAGRLSPTHALYRGPVGAGR